ncbi:hypothetical protein [Bacillus sp. V59.32b]|uniref:hypothetical protein n=1 Tax=Bacillus sp. V59.32b TaxID=1758642 RepID=UPI000E3E9C0C|nr:hypothetical protein [Bacillus sp. V59.32b]RFU62766.1 hypothetical protein D0463_12850 [Bacillus sp. V59.32b]
MMRDIGMVTAKSYLEKLRYKTEIFRARNPARQQNGDLGNEIWPWQQNRNTGNESPRCGNKTGKPGNKKEI